jgi:acetyl-CoA C-acetyltransferase
MLIPVIGLLHGLTDHVCGLSMGQTAEILASRFGIEREYMDAYSLQSHQRLAYARKNAYLDEITPLYDHQGNVYSDDTGLRDDTSMEKLARLKPVFDKNYGNITAGNSAQVTDGAAVVLLASEKAVEQHGLPILGRLVDAHWAGLDPSIMGLGPVYAMTPILQRHRLTLDDIDFWEINEAFAAQVLACTEAWKSRDFCVGELGLKQAVGAIDADKLNIDGGGISLGHPVGASGARIVLHLLKVLQRNNARLGMASLCIGGGQGGAMLVENMQAGATA